MPAGPLAEFIQRARRTGDYWPSLKKPLQILGQLLGAFIALVRLLGHRLEDDGLEINRNVPIPMSQRFGACSHSLEKKLYVAGVLGRMHEGGQLVERHAERIDVGAMIDERATAHGLLRTHVAHRAEDIATMR